MNRSDDQNRNWFRLVGQIADPLESVNNSRTPKPNDILLGRGKGKQRHAGNVDFLRKIDQNLALYHQQKRGHKQDIVSMIIEWVRDNNGSFLAETFEGNWVEVNESTAKEKVAQAFRHRKMRLQESNESVAAKGTIVKDKRRDAGEIAETNTSIASTEKKRIETTGHLPQREQSAAPSNISLGQEGQPHPHLNLTGARAKLDRDWEATKEVASLKLAQIHSASGTAGKKYEDGEVSEVGGCAIDNTHIISSAVMTSESTCNTGTEPKLRPHDANPLKRPLGGPQRQQFLDPGRQQQQQRHHSSELTRALHMQNFFSKSQSSLPSSSDEIVSDAEILAVVKGWDA